MGLRFYSEEEWKLSEVDMSEIDGLRQIGGLRKELDGLKKVSVGSLDAMVGTIVKGKGRGMGKDIAMLSSVV